MDIKALEEHFDRHHGQVKEMIAEAKGLGEGNAARLTEIEQKLDREVRGGGGATPRPTAGSLFTENSEVKAFSGNDVRPGRRLSVETKAIFSALTTSADGSAGDLLVPYRDNVVSTPKRRLMIRDLLPTIQITGNSVQYPKLVSFTNNAATVSETSGAAKPQSDGQFDIVTVNVTTIAHYVDAMRQILDDAPQLKGLIDTELLYGVAYVEDNQLLNGAGTGTDINGIYTQATASTANLMVVASPTKLDVIGVALLQQSLTNLPPDGIVVHPADWTSMQLIKDSAGNYIIGNPQGATQPRLFGVPVVVTPAMSSGNFLVGSFQSSATLYDRWAARVEVSTENSDNFIKNKVTILAEERIALAVKSPLGFTKGSFATQITDLTS